MSRVNSKPAVVMVSAMLLEPVQTATERHEPGTVVTWPLSQVEALVANGAAAMLTADELAVIAAAADANAKAKLEAEANAQALAEAEAKAAAEAAALAAGQSPAGGSLL